MTSQGDNLLIINVLEGILGSPKNSKNAEAKNQWEFNCPSPKCKHDHDKFNLAYKSSDHVFKCWKCKYSGFIYRLVYDHGSSSDLARLKLILPEYKTSNFNVFKKPEINYDLITCDLPEGYMHLNQERNSKLYNIAYEYATKTRKISPQQIDRFQIGYTETGPRKYRIILPSLNAAGKINYFEARSYMLNPKLPYYKPDSPNVEDIIFNEFYINWDLPVYLVEGVFDSLRIPNSIPLLGKGVSPLLLKRLLDNNCKVILCLDSDAFADSLNIYNQLNSLGLDVYFVDLKGKKDISKTYEDSDNGKEAVASLLKTATKIDTSFQIRKLLNE
jgi:hypothetical protein